MEFELRIAHPEDAVFAPEISELYRVSALERGTGIAIRTPDYIAGKMKAGNAIIGLHADQLAGFCYIETFSNGEYVSNSGLIVAPTFRSRGLAVGIKHMAFHYAREKYPDAKVFGITTSNRVMEINSHLGYIPVAFYKLTRDDEFWAGCKSCPNYEILQRNNKSMCLCTGMLAPSLNETDKKANPEPEKQTVK